MIVLAVAVGIVSVWCFVASLIHFNDGDGSSAGIGLFCSVIFGLSALWIGGLL